MPSDQSGQALRDNVHDPRASGSGATCETTTAG
jgi:hypothetical protein